MLAGLLIAVAEENTAPRDNGITLLKNSPIELSVPAALWLSSKMKIALSAIALRAGITSFLATEEIWA